MTDRTVRRGEPTGLDLYRRTAQDAASAVIASYSTSFGMACRLLGPRVRPHVRNVYALVRIADEIVDGPAEAAGLTAEQARDLLDDLERDVERAIATGFSANLVVQAFGDTARECGIGSDLVRPFFASMRTDLSVSTHDDSSHDAYVYGSAEVVGLMCLQTFAGAGMPHPVVPAEHLTAGARRLGAAFQDVNFVRDLDHDASALGRDYLGLTTGERTRDEVLDRIDADLAAAAAVIPDLPADCRRAVTAAHDLFAALSSRLRHAAPGAARVRVPDPVKAGIAARALMGAGPRSVRA